MNLDVFLPDFAVFFGSKSFGKGASKRRAALTPRWRMPWRTSARALPMPMWRRSRSSNGPVFPFQNGREKNNKINNMEKNPDQYSFCGCSKLAFFQLLLLFFPYFSLFLAPWFCWAIWFRAIRLERRKKKAEVVEPAVISEELLIEGVEAGCVPCAQSC